jgi:hypothetical protein
MEQEARLKSLWKGWIIGPWHAVDAKRFAQLLRDVYEQRFCL